MDLGIAGRKAIICGASRGLGRAIANSLASESVSLVINGRDKFVLDEAADEMRRLYDVPICTAPGDISTELGRRAVLDAMPDADILVTNAGGPPPSPFQATSMEQWRAALDTNMLSPIFLIQALVDGMARRGFGRVVNITSAGVQSPASYPDMGTSVGARAGLTAAVAALARQVIRHNVTINGILPGRFMTQRLASNLEYSASRRGSDVRDEMEQARERIPAGRFGRPEEVGALCAYLCSQHAGYLTGKSFVLDGGMFPGLL